MVTIAPGIFNTPILSEFELNAEQMKQFVSDLRISFPVRMGEPREFGEMVAAICKIRYLNGEVIRLDGGLHLS